MTLWLTVGKVDMDGFCGREYHPTPALNGTTLRVLKADTEQDPECEFMVFTCLLPEGGLVEIVDCEVATVVLGETPDQPVAEEELDRDDYRVDREASPDELAAWRKLRGL